MKNLLVSPHIAKQLSILDYNQPCLAYYISNDDDGDGINPIYKDEPLCNSDLINDAFTAPTYQQVVDFFRNEHSICIESTTWPTSTTWMIRNSKTNETIFNCNEMDYYIGFNKIINESLKLI